MAITKIAQVDLAANAATITFVGIPASFTDLMVMLSGCNTTAGNDNAIVQLNGVTTGYTWVWLAGNGTTASSTNQTGMGITNGIDMGLIGGSNLTASTFTNASIYIPNYTSTVAKTFSSDAVMENNAANPAHQAIVAGSVGITSAITSLTILCYGGSTLAQYSSATLYGISKSGATGATVA